MVAGQISNCCTLIEILDSLTENFSTGLFHEAAFKKGISKRTADERIRIARDSCLIERVAQGKFRKRQVTQVTQFPIGVAQPAQTFSPKNAHEVTQVTRNDADCTTRTTESSDEYRMVF